MSKRGKRIVTKGSLLVSVIGDEPTVTGFLLTGIGERNKKGETNFLVVNKDTPISKINQVLEGLLAR
jgi:V-type H+-transporting ATPase subunit F